VILRTDGYLEDAVVLAGSLRRSPSAEAELRGYEARRLHRANLVIDQS
jgi:2-polyprenyl-6-methoxyphenol hydroxylase-like FAD-dependent oxidoreductase